MEIPCLTCHPNHTSPTHTLPSAGFSLTHNLAASNPCSGPLKIKGKVPECGTQNFRSKIHCKATVIIKNKFKLILTLSIRTFANVFSQYVSRFFFYAPRRISGEHIVAALSVRPCVRASVRPYVRVSVRPCVRPALVHANSRKLLVGFQ